MRFNWTIQRKLLGFGLLGIVLGIVVGFSGYSGLKKTGEAMSKISTSASFIKNHITANMMLGALRSDVLSGLLIAAGAGTETEEQLEKNIQEHARTFRLMLTKNANLSQNSDLSQLVHYEMGVLERYVGEAEHLVSLKSDLVQIIRRLPKFQADFDYLTKEMEKISDISENQVKLRERFGIQILNTTKNFILGTLAFGILLLTAGSILISRLIGKPINEISSAMTKVGKGDYTVMVKARGQDEIGLLAEGFMQMIEGLKKGTALRKTLSKTAASLAVASKELTASSEEMSVHSKETSKQAERVSNASDETNKNVQSVSSASSEMSVTIKEISKSVQETNRITLKAVDIAKNTNLTITKLGISSDEIGKVVKVIKSIAQQTNLLALNATIEAARAGKAGKGFAVVANEVKDLAKGTAEATEEISNQVITIQTDTKNAIAAIEEIGEVIRKINEIALSVSGAVEEQSATTAEITRNIVEAARGTSKIVENIKGISNVSVSATESASSVLKSSQDLSKLADQVEMVLNDLNG